MIKQFELIRDEIVENIKKVLKSDATIENLLEVYNFYCNEERGGDGYIYCIENDDDVKNLVASNKLTAKGIAFLVNHEMTYFQFNGEKDEGVFTLSEKEVKETILRYAPDFVSYSLLYALICGGNSSYGWFYENYVFSVLEDEGFDGKEC